VQWADRDDSGSFLAGNAVSAFLQRLKLMSIHEPADALLAAMNVLAPKHLLDAPRAVGPTAFQENKRDFLCKDDILLASIALKLFAMVVKPAAADRQSQTHFGNAVTTLRALNVGDHFVEFPGSWHKIPKAFFKMSRCRLTVSSSRRSRAFSAARLAGSAGGEPPPPDGPPAAESLP
jgi:hypothetical protein